MYKHYVEGVQNRKKVYLISVGNICVLLYCSLEESDISFVQITEVENRILNSHVTLYEALNRYASSL